MQLSLAVLLAAAAAHAPAGEPAPLLLTVQDTAPPSPGGFFVLEPSPQQFSCGM